MKLTSYSEIVFGLNSTINKHIKDMQKEQDFSFSLLFQNKCVNIPYESKNIVAN